MVPTFQQAFEQLLSRAPGPVFPRARALYLRKYCLEAASASRFRTFLLEEEIEEGEGGLVVVRALAFAVVHWQAAQLPAGSYLDYLRERWQLEPADLLPVDEEPWFREGGAWARFTAQARIERLAAVSPLIRSGGPDGPAGAHAASP